MANNKGKFFLVVIILIAFLVSIFIYMDISSDADKTASMGNGGEAKKEAPSAKNENDSLVKILSLLKNLKIDKSIFESNIFKNLSDFSVTLPQVIPGKIDPTVPAEMTTGRSNPFAPIDTIVSGAVSSATTSPSE